MRALWLCLFVSVTAGCAGGTRIVLERPSDPAGITLKLEALKEQYVAGQPVDEGQQFRDKIMADWLQHCEPKLDAARDEGVLRLAHAETRQILRAMHRHLRVHTRLARKPGTSHIFFSSIGPGRDILSRNAGHALQVARALLQQPNTYQDGRSYYRTSTSHNARQDADMRWRSVLVILLLRDEESIPFLREALDREMKVVEAVLVGDLRTSDGKTGGMVSPVEIERLCRYAIELLEKGEEVRWYHGED